MKEPQPLLWPNFLYRVNIYSNERSPWSKLCVDKQCTRGVRAVQPQVPCVAEVRNLCVARQLCIDRHGKCSVHHEVHYAHGDMVPFRMLCAIRP